MHFFLLTFLSFSSFLVQFPHFIHSFKIGFSYYLFLIDKLGKKERKGSTATIPLKYLEIAINLLYKIISNFVVNTLVNKNEIIQNIIISIYFLLNETTN